MGSLSSVMLKRRRNSLFSLGTTLYRVGHRLSLSKVLISEKPMSLLLSLHVIILYRFFLQLVDNKAKCAMFFKQCLAVLREQDNLVCRFPSVFLFIFILVNC